MSGLYCLRYGDGSYSPPRNMRETLDAVKMYCQPPFYRPVAVEPVAGTEYRVVSDDLPSALWHPLPDVATLRRRLVTERPACPRGIQIRSPR